MTLANIRANGVHTLAVWGYQRPPRRNEPDNHEQEDGADSGVEDLAHHTSAERKAEPHERGRQLRRPHAPGVLPWFSSCETAVITWAGANGFFTSMLLGTP